MLKRCFLLHALSLSLVISVAVYAADSGGLNVTPSSFDFGDVEQGELAIARFQVSNTGTSAATIQWMEFSEQGLIAQVNPQIAPGKSVEVLVNWNTANFEGQIEGAVTLGFIHPVELEITLNVSGNVVPSDDSIPSQ